MQTAKVLSVRRIMEHKHQALCVFESGGSSGTAENFFSGLVSTLQIRKVPAKASGHIRIDQLTFFQ
jgi:hypothetical protein